MRPGLAIAGGALSVLPLLAALVAPGILILTILAPLPLFLVGLGQGQQAFLIAAATALVLMLLAGGPTAALGEVAVILAPVGILAHRALASRPRADGSRGWYPAGHLAAWLTALGALWVVVQFLMLHFGSAEPTVEATLKREIEASLAALLPETPEQNLALMARMAAPFGLGMLVTSWMLLLALNGILAQGVLARFSRQLRPSPDIAALRLPAWPSWCLAGSVALAYLAPGDLGYLSRNLAVVFLLPFFFAGLAVIHAVCRKLSAGSAMLVAFYAVLFFFAWIAALVAVVGLMDQWAEFRRRLGAGATGQEEE